MMRKMSIWAAVAAAIIMVSGCGQNTEQETTPVISSQETQETAETPEETETTKQAETPEQEETPAVPKETIKIETSGQSAQENDSTGGYEDNFAVDSAAAADFGAKIQEAVAEKDLEKLANLTSFPVYVGLEGAGAVETKEEFLALGADQVFTQALTDSVAAANLDALSPSMAGFVLSDGSAANMIFSVQNGKLAVSGINY